MCGWHGLSFPILASKILWIQNDQSPLRREARGNFIFLLPLLCQTVGTLSPNVFRQEAGMSLYCQECGSQNVRRAHFRFSDAVRLLTFRYPVRCRDCKKRWHAQMRDARLLPHAPHRRNAEKAT